jgi:hypothetical protein
MSKPQSLEQVRSCIEKILNTLRLTRVVCVDDTYVDEIPVEVVMVAACSLEKAALKKALPELEEPIPEDDDVLKEQIRRLWNKLEEPVRMDHAKSILTAEGLRDNAATDDFRDASILRELIPKGMLTELSPEQWEEHGNQLLKANAKQPTLFLFDQDLSKGGGAEEGGIMIISSLLAGKDPALICGLLTHTVTPENQPQKWVELSTAHNIDRDRFLVVPKRYISKDPVLFAQTLKLVALSPDFTILKQKTAGIIGDAVLTASRHIDDISIYDLDHIVFQVSADEGLWEPDMLFRLHALFHRLESQRLAHEGGELETIARRLRSVSQIPTLTAFVPASTTWQIQRKELYEPAEHLNKNHLPLELGDIFIKTNTESRKCYILLAQPCDLMVRSDGRRKPEVVHVPLAEIAPAPDRPQFSEEMEYFGESPSKNWYVKLKRVHQVRVNLLDLCTFNDEGSATMQVDDEPPDSIRPAWKARYAILAKLFGRLLKQLDVLSPSEGELPGVKEIKSGLMSDLLDEGLFKGKAFNQNDRPIIAYNCRRVCRLSRARAFGLLMIYTGLLSRPAYDRPFG